MESIPFIVFFFCHRSSGEKNENGKWKCHDEDELIKKRQPESTARARSFMATTPQNSYSIWFYIILHFLSNACDESRSIRLHIPFLLNYQWNSMKRDCQWNSMANGFFLFDAKKETQFAKAESIRFRGKCKNRHRCDRQKLKLDDALNAWIFE